jgi:ribosome biogenesis GTPase / thiamine phosphate phosphatase
VIEAVLPRIGALIRKAAGEDRPQLLAANIDVVFIMTTPDADLSLPRLERYLALVPNF